jgi:hypothetical protein
VLTQAERVGRTPLIVRARSVSWNPPLATYSIVHVIYGDFKDDTIVLDRSWEPAHDPPDLINLGREVVLELRPVTPAVTNAATVNYQAWGISYVADRSEPEIIQSIADGSAFQVSKSVRVADQMRDIQLIVRAKLEQINDGEFKWKIVRALKGTAATETLIIGDELFRQRARTIVADRARRQAEPPSTRETGSTTRPSATPDQAVAIDVESRRLIEAELKDLPEAILFLDQAQGQPDAIHARLRYRTYDDGQKNLDALEARISSGLNLP